jgi:hypothetical protein
VVVLAATFRYSDPECFGKLITHVIPATYTRVPNHCFQDDAFKATRA